MTRIRWVIERGPRRVWFSGFEVLTGHDLSSPENLAFTIC